MGPRRGAVNGPAAARRGAPERKRSLAPRPLDRGSGNVILVWRTGRPAITEIAPARPVAPGTRIGHVRLEVADIGRMLDFYVGVPGFTLTQRYGTQAAFVSAGGYHHHLAFDTWESAGGSPPPAGATGLYHLAILYPTRADLADAARRLAAAGWPLDGASDHGVSEALYLRDPEGNGVELCADLPEAAWPRDAAGRLAMTTRRLDPEELLATVADS
jgi:catechol 2,3-dioxygenase